MSYWVCYKCDVYYEMENKQEALKFTHCDCGKKLVFFESLEDSYTETVNQESDNESSERPKNEPTRETMANGKKYTEKSIRI